MKYGSKEGCRSNRWRRYNRRHWFRERATLCQAHWAPCFGNTSRLSRISPAAFLKPNVWRLRAVLPLRPSAPTGKHCRRIKLLSCRFANRRRVLRTSIWTAPSAPRPPSSVKQPHCSIRSRPGFSSERFTRGRYRTLFEGDTASTTRHRRSLGASLRWRLQPEWIGQPAASSIQLVGAGHSLRRWPSLWLTHLPAANRRQSSKTWNAAYGGSKSILLALG